MSQSSLNTNIAHVRVCESILQLAHWQQIECVPHLYALFFALVLIIMMYNVSGLLTHIAHVRVCEITLADRRSAYRTSCCNELVYRGTQCEQALNCVW